MLSCFVWQDPNIWQFAFGLVPCGDWQPGTFVINWGASFDCESTAHIGMVDGMCSK